MAEKLLDLLFKSYRRQVLMLLLLNPEQQYHVREIARLTHTVAGTVNKELLKLAQAGLLKRSNQGNQILYSANKDCLIYTELVSILTKTTTSALTKAAPVKRSRVLEGDGIESLKRMLDAIRRINQCVDNKIQLSHSPNIQKVVMRQLSELLEASELLVDKSVYGLNEIEAIMTNGSSLKLETVWAVITQKLPALELQLLKAME